MRCINIFFIGLILISNFLVKDIYTYNYRIKKGEKWICIVKRAPVYNLKNRNKRRVKFFLKLREKIKVLKYYKSKNYFDLLSFKKNNNIYFTPFEFFAKYQKNISGNLPYKVKIDRWNNIPFDYRPNDLKRIPSRYISPYLRKWKYYLRKEALINFMKLIDAAKVDGVKIFIASAYRSPIQQSYLYLKNIKAAGPKQIGSAKPTYSEHHLGSTCDLTCKAVGYRLTQRFYYTKAYKWLNKNISRFNIRITYSKISHKREGYLWEPWHLRYMGK